MLNELIQQAGQLRQLVAREKDHPLGHVLNGGYGMEKAAYDPAFAEVSDALSEANALDAQHEAIKEVMDILSGEEPTKVSIRIHMGIQGALLTQDEMFEKIKAQMPDQIEALGEEQVRAAVANTFQQGSNHEQHSFELYCERLGRDAALDIIKLVQPKIPHGDKSAVARQLRAMADSLENGEA